MSQQNYRSTILIVDDEQDIADLLKTVLKREGFSNVHTAHTVKDGLAAFKRYMPDLVLLDIMLPDGNGYDLYSALQAIKPVSILFVSAKDEEVDRLLGFAMGADDYITKPFSAKEVAFRVKARLRSATNTLAIEKTHPNLTFGNITIDINAQTVYKNGDMLDLTAKELTLLIYLAQHPNRILSKEMICAAVWGEDFIGFDNTISVHIRKLRLKIEDQPSHPKWIQTVIGLGYKLVIRGDS
ncbi:DNA-binding response regulator [Halolactibacillus alkaliphilus]|uniref:DNA-binding response regulator n=1 Tax=Halolactibacillus alkaliphilus TaxID=442899 RepID=A0A511X0C3_9BACI|nr:response regulator transcription factor [Halolactibacillus alkaliphilus]GEN56371.1 DNA-binding response regulator [Halolactibacillus alkaliphilus]GGN67486.1 DNA-binding response regulator [Halolactibacillus alkaliphilus]SFO91975.1 DNA-binding response regulator, OmpR family, contains REC and winged-helix (wHTH) domain [Halolactibacillus alkaliphilus]